MHFLLFLFHCLFALFSFYVTGEKENDIELLVGFLLLLLIIALYLFFYAASCSEVKRSKQKMDFPLWVATTVRATGRFLLCFGTFCMMVTIVGMFSSAVRMIAQLSGL